MPCKMNPASTRDEAHFPETANISQAWFEDFGAGGITSVSFATNLPPRLKGDSESGFRVPDFVVGTDRAYIVTCTASAFEELDPERR